MNFLTTIPDDMKRPGATDTEIDAAAQALSYPIPPEVRAFLRQTNGLEGFIAPGVYLSLWTAAEIAPLNDAYAVQESLPEFLLIGTDGGGMGYGYRIKGAGTTFVEVDLIGMSPEEGEELGDSFDEFVAHLRGRAG